MVLGPVTLRTWMKCLTSQVCHKCEHVLPTPWQGAWMCFHSCVSAIPHGLSCLSTPHQGGGAQIYFSCCCPWTFPLEKLLSKRSRASPAQDEATSQGDADSARPSPAPADPGTVAELHKQIEELTSQNSELALKVQVRSERVQLHEYARAHTWLEDSLREDKLIVKWLLNGSQAEDEASGSRVAWCLWLRR